MEPVKPIIGITAERGMDDRGRSWVRQTEAYAAAIQQVGGVPVLLPPVRQADFARPMAARIDGLLLSGGDDPDPVLWGEPPHPALGPVDSERDGTEIALVQAALTRRVPILGICRGIQILNVALGGSIIQDIPAQVPDAWQHMQKGPRWQLGHEIRVEPRTRLAGIFGDGPMRVNTFHHQAVGRIGKGLVISARTGDGIVEAIEMPGETWVVAVEWHPEVLLGRHPNAKSLFDAFIQASSSGVQPNTGDGRSQGHIREAAQ